MKLEKTEQSIRVFKMIGLCLCTVGLATALYNFMSAWAGVTTPGEVLSVESLSGSGKRSGASYKPTFLFSDDNEQQHTAPTSYSSSTLNYPIGTVVNINYDPQDLSTVRIATIGQKLMLPMIFFGMGVVMIAAAVATERKLP